MADTKSVLLTDCTDEIPMGNVTRQFDFGQFVRLYQVRVGNPNESDPIVIINRGLGPTGTAGAQRGFAASSGAQRSYEVSLFSLIESQLETIPLPVEDIDGILQTHTIQHGGLEYRIELDSDSRSGLRRGARQLCPGVRVKNGERKHVVTDLQPKVTDVDLTPDALDELLARREIEYKGQKISNVEPYARHREDTVGRPEYVHSRPLR